MDPLRKVILTFARAISLYKKQGLQTPAAYDVGGSVRDTLMHAKASGDWDLEVYGVDIESVAREIYKTFSFCDIQEEREFGVWRISLEGIKAEISLPRRERVLGDGHRDIKVVHDAQMDFSEALKRRDFTMNAILSRVDIPEIHDPFGGREDILAGILRMVDADAFPHDPLRAYRALRYMATHAVVPDEGLNTTLHVMGKNNVPERLSYERKGEELAKILSGPRALPALFLGAESGIFDEALARALQKEWIRLCAVDEHVRGLAPSEMMLLRCSVLAGNSSEYQALYGRYAWGNDLRKTCLECIHAAGAYQRLRLGADTTASRLEREADIVSWFGAYRSYRYLAPLLAYAKSRHAHSERASSREEILAWVFLCEQELPLVATAHIPLVSGRDIESIALRIGVQCPKGEEFGTLLRAVASARKKGSVRSRSEALRFLEAQLRSLQRISHV